MTNCYKCGNEIFFDDDCLSDSGKKIPLDEEYDGENMIPHNCPIRDYRPKDTTVGTSLEKRLDALEQRIYNLEIGK